MSAAPQAAEPRRSESPAPSPRFAAILAQCRAEGAVFTETTIEGLQRQALQWIFHRILRRAARSQQGEA